MEVDEKEYQQMQTDLKSANEMAGTVEGLQTSMLKLEENNKLLLQEKKDAKTATQQAIEDAAKKTGDDDALEKSWKAKLATVESALNEQIGVYKNTISGMTSGEAALKLAAKLGIPNGGAEALLPHIKPRVVTEYIDGKPEVRVLDKNGKLSAMSLDDLEVEMIATKYLAPNLIGSMANGDGYAGKKGGDMSKVMNRDAFNSMSAVDQAKHFKEGGKVVD